MDCSVYLGGVLSSKKNIPHLKQNYFEFITLPKCLKQPISKSKQLFPHSEQDMFNSFKIFSIFWLSKDFFFIFQNPLCLLSEKKMNELIGVNSSILDLSSLFNQQTVWRTDKSLVVSLPHGSPSHPHTLLMIGAVWSSLMRWCWLVVASWHELPPHLKAGLLEGWHDLLKVQVVVWWDCNGYRERVYFCKERKEVGIFKKTIQKSMATPCIWQAF